MRNRLRAAVALGLFCLFAAVQGSPAQNGLGFFKNYFITGDYTVGGVGLDVTGSQGLASGYIEFNDELGNAVPDDVEVVAAFLYWQVVTDARKDGSDPGSLEARFNGLPLSTPGGPIGAVLENPGSSGCWSSGGAGGKSGGAKQLFTYRSDVLRMLPLENGRHVVNDFPFLVEVPDGGNGNKTPLALGASLVILYRDLSEPLRSIVVYDGGHVMDKTTGGLTQTIAGFYDAADAPGKLTHIVGNGQANKADWLIVNTNGTDTTYPGAEFRFRASAGPGWDNITVATPPATGSSISTTVNGGGASSFDCLNWGAIVYSTPVNDADEDGLLDLWEDSTELLEDPSGVELPNLHAMGADSMRKDLFIEINYFEAFENLYYGGVQKPAHSHLPTPTALKMMGDAFAGSPELNPDGSTGIRVHFDVGPSYADPDSLAAPYLVPSALATGGERLDEMETVCTREAGSGDDEGDAPWVCQFGGDPDAAVPEMFAHPGTVGWKSGFRFVRDGFVDQATGQATPECSVAEEDLPANCAPRFDPGRKDVFRYALFAHSLGVPKEDCLLEEPDEEAGFPDYACMEGDPLFHTPVTNTGVSDYLGGDMMITMGGFPNAAGLPIGTDFMQASTLMHETGHGLGRTHAGDAFDVNCAPNYLSVMNYLFQLRGLTDPFGGLRIDYSSEELPTLGEATLSDPDSLGGIAPYQTAWYAPLVEGSVGAALGLPAAKGHCDGSPLMQGETPAYRVQGAPDNIDWDDRDDTEHPFGGQQDINFDGDAAGELPGSDDWANLKLNQVGARRNVGVWFYSDDEGAYYIGPASLGFGRGDLGRGDLGRGDLGRGDLGRGDLGRGDLGRGDLGRGDLGRGDLGRGDLGRGDLGRGDLGRGDLGRGDLGVGADISAEIAASLGNTPPNSLTVTRNDEGCDGSSPATCHRMILSWLPPNVGQPVKYVLTRVAGDALTPDSQPVVVDDNIDPVPGLNTLTDLTELPNGYFTYYVQALFAGEGATTILSGPSNTATELSINDSPDATDDAPTAEDDEYETEEDIPLVVAAPGVLANDSDVDSPVLTAILATLPSNGTLTFTPDVTLPLEPNGSFTYVPNPGWYGTDTFTYVVGDADPSRTSNEATVTIEVLPCPYELNPVAPADSAVVNGTTVTIDWRMSCREVIEDSSDAQIEVIITGPDETVYSFTEEAPGFSAFVAPVEETNWLWSFAWSAVVDGETPVPAGEYTVQIHSGKTGQTFDAGTVTLEDTQTPQ